MKPSFMTAAIAAIILVSCGTAAPSPVESPIRASSSPTQGPTASSVAAQPSATQAAGTPWPLEPICSNAAQPLETPDPHAGDGTKDPDGRIVFGRMTRTDHVKGQIVSLFAVDPDGSDLAGLLNCEVARPRFSPDGTRIAFGIVMEDQSLQVATMAADGSDLRILTNTPGYAETPDWSPDGSWLIYSYAPRACTDFEECVLDGNLWTLWRMNVDGSDQRLIGNPDQFDWEPRLSPDGDEVVFQRLDPAADWSMTLWIRNLVTGDERMVMTDVRPLEHPDWSPDGKWIIYNPTGCGPCEQIERVPSDDPTAEPEVLYRGGDLRAGFKPVYSPDGSKIAFGCREGLCVMDADGANVVVVVPTLGRPEVNHFDWGVTPLE